MGNKTFFTKKIRKKTCPPTLFSKKSWRVGIFSIFGLLVGVVFPVILRADFRTNLQGIQIDTQNLQDKKGISRYELARLLNASECKDCLVPNKDMVTTYNQSFWNIFPAKPGNYFADIDYLGGLFNEKSYYYCVAYVGDHQYMNGYPASTSPICAGKFCGAQNTTKAEFLQVVINLLAKYIYADIQIDWKQALSRMNKLTPESYEERSLDDDDKKIIQEQAENCKETNCYLTGPEQVKTYLRYCMFNLAICGMENIGKIKQGAWPVAELNLLIRQRIITLNPDEWNDIGALIDGETVMNVLGKVQEKIQCTFNNDYDCDGLDNTADNCPNDYNPSQKDTDNDGIGDVCDDDIDGDGTKNPIGIVDDQGRINIRLRTPNITIQPGQTTQPTQTTPIDNCLFVQNPDQGDSDQNHIGDLCEQLDANNNIGLYIVTKDIPSSAPVTVNFEAVSRGNISQIQRDFGDGTTSLGTTASHTFSEAGTYRVQATATNETQRANAQLVLKIGGINEQQSALQIRTNKVGSYQKAEITLQASSIGADEIERIVDQNPGVKKTINQPFQRVYTSTGPHNVIVKAYKEKALSAITTFTIGIGEIHGAMLKADMLNPEINQKVNFQTQTFNTKPENISYVYRDFGDGTTQKNNILNTSHEFPSGGRKAVQQKIVFTDGQEITNIITIFVVDPSLLRSYAIILTPSKLVSRLGEKISFVVSKVGDSRETPLRYTAKWETQDNRTFSKQRKLPITDTYMYSQNGRFAPIVSAFLNQCSYLKAQASIAVNGSDICLQAKIDGTLNKVFSCDMDKDKIPDICDDDIDGDGIPNLIGIITQENKDCSFTLTTQNPNQNSTNNDNNNNGNNNNGGEPVIGNINQAILNKHFQNICTLDNAPFSSNTNQLDLNGDNQGDTGLGIGNLGGGQGTLGGGQGTGAGQQGTLFLGDNGNDTDGDGIIDTMDICPTIHGMGNDNGCPEIEKCTTRVPAFIENECLQCPCQYTDFAANLSNGDQVQAMLRDKKKITLYNFSLPRVINF